jgi:hypothetical protein
VQLLASNYRDALLQDLTRGVPETIADEFEAIDDDDDDIEEDDDDDGIASCYYCLINPSFIARCCCR